MIPVYQALLAKMNNSKPMKSDTLKKYSSQGNIFSDPKKQTTSKIIKQLSPKIEFLKQCPYNPIE
jgi:hypothetical protein